MKSKLFGGILCMTMLCLIMCTVVMAEDVPMTEEEIINVEENFSVETENEEELIVAEEEEEFLEADGLVEDEEILEAAEDFSFNTAIPDSTFQTFLKVRGWTTLDRISKVTELNIAGMGIEDLTGIKYFTNLQTLNCRWNNLTNLDVSSLTALEELNCSVNNIANLDVSGCTTLKKLDCSTNELLVSLDMSGFATLRTLTCSNCRLTSLDVTGCTKLEDLYCMDNSLTSLDISSCISLKHLQCDRNSLASLDVSFCPNLTDINADESTTILHNHEHAWDSGKVTKKATTTAEGVKTYTCIFDGCRQTKTEKIPKLKAPAEKRTISKKPTIKKPTAAKGKITVKWKHFKHTSKKAKKIWKKIKKVQVQCATDKACKNIVKDVKVSRGKTKYTIKGLSKKTTYYVRARYFDGVGYSNWSKVKKVKTKK